MIFYPYLLAAHITSVMFLIGGMLAQDMILKSIVSHSPEQQAATCRALLQFERRITSPALLLTWIFGISLALSGGWFSARWLQIKLVFVVVISTIHGLQSGRLQRFFRDGQPAKGIPAAGIVIVLFAMLIAILAVLKPIN